MTRRCPLRKAGWNRMTKRISKVKKMEILLKAKGGSNSNSNRKLYQQFLDGEKVAPNKRRGQKKFF
jgi:hypothetical protein